MRKIILLIISLNVFANNIINYNVYKRDDRIDVMLSFDSPYSAKDGDIRILSGKDYIGVVLNNVKIADRNSQILNTPFAEQLLMYPVGEGTALEFKTKEKLSIIPALTKDDGFGLRIRVLPKIAKQTNTEIQYANDDNIDTKLYSMLGVLIIVLFALFYIKRRLNNKIKIPNSNSKHIVANFLNINENQAVVICEKQLDKDNKFIVVEYDNSKYKLIIGNTNIWLDAPNQSEENFETYFEENKQKLQNMIKQNALNSYKEKISKIYGKLMRRNKKTKITIFFSIIVIAAILVFVGFSNTFERVEPLIKLTNNDNETIYWNGRDKIGINISDNLALKSVKVEYVKDNEENKTILINKKINDKTFNVDLDLPKPKFNEQVSKYTVYIQANDKSLWNWFSGNTTEKIINIILDNKKPQVSVIANSYSITQGGAASVVFYAQDDNLTDLYIEVNNRIFKAIPFLKDDYYIAIIAWDLRDGNEFEARIVAKDKANNVIKERIPYYYTNKKYRVSTISVNDSFIDGKIKDLYEANSDNTLNNRALIFDFVNAKLRDENEKIIHKITKTLSDEPISDFKLNAFLPLKNGMKVADFGDHRYYKYNGEQISESFHLGLDLASTKMAPIVLSNSGKIVFAQDNGIYGLNLIIDHGLGLFTLYGHCTKKNVEVGDIVNAKTTIANTGTSGLALGDHLHFGVLVQGVEVRPEEWMDNKWLNDNIFSIIKKAKEIINKK